MTFAVSATDIADAEVAVQCSPSSGALFPIATTEVRCVATDDSRNTATRTFNVTVTTDGHPKLILPDDITTTATTVHGAPVTFDASATDYADRSILVVCWPPSGTVFSVGTATVQCSATDDRERTTYGTFEVTVTDAPAHPPVITVPADITVEAATPAGTSVSFRVTAHDEVDGNVPVTCTPPSGATFSIGTTIVTCTAENSRGLTATEMFDVTVVDTIAPTIVAITADPNRLWPANKKLVDVVVSVTASDAGDASPHARVTNVSVSESAAADDWSIVNDLTVQLRAERNGKEARVYTIAIEVADASGNVSTGTVDVLVPRDNSDDGAAQPVSRRRSSRH